MADQLEELAGRKTAPGAPGTSASAPNEVRRLLALLPGWEDRGGREIAKTFRFQNYCETMAFVNAVAWVAHRTDHHPDLEVGYNRCVVRYSTHSVGGLSENDFVCAARIERLTRT